VCEQHLYTFAVSDLAGAVVGRHGFIEAERKEQLRLVTTEPPIIARSRRSPHRRITLRGRQQPTSATKSARNRHSSRVCEMSVRRNGLLI
jgi:hypothetical protein